MSDIERWLYRAWCQACGAVLWTDRPARVVCVCSGSAIEADGSLSGEASPEVSDQDLIDFVKQDLRREVTLEQVEL